MDVDVLYVLLYIYDYEHLKFIYKFTTKKQNKTKQNKTNVIC